MVLCHINGGLFASLAIITEAKKALPDSKQQPEVVQPRVVVWPEGNSLDCLARLNSSELRSVVVDLATRCRWGLVATFLPVQIVLRFHRLLGFISLAWLRLFKCIEGNAEIEKT